MLCIYTVSVLGPHITGNGRLGYGESSVYIVSALIWRLPQVGGIVLHQGRVAEMKTGEGKTLVATLPAYLHALTGKGVHIVTVNDYLAQRDAAW